MPTKKTSKKNSKKTKTKIRTKIIEKIKYVPININHNTESNFFSLADNNVFQIFKGYKDIYEFIINKSLEYKLEFTPINESLGDTNVMYFKKGLYGSNTNPNLTTKMHIVGYLDGNTWTWNNYQIRKHYNIFLSYVVPLLINSNPIKSLSKLFEHNQITFPERYRQTIPYLLSYMYDPQKANIVRLSNNILSGHSLTFAYIEMSLDIPYWYQMTDHIAKELNMIGYGGGFASGKNIRIIKDGFKGHITNYTNKFKKILLSEKNKKL